MILSASRRTDIPAFYMGWFFRRLEAGFCRTVNPFNRRRFERLARELEGSTGRVIVSMLDLYRKARPPAAASTPSSWNVCFPDAPSRGQRIAASGALAAARSASISACRIPGGDRTEIVFSG
jgi:hypothetical protein